MDYIRKQRAHPDHDPNTQVSVLEHPDHDPNTPVGAGLANSRVLFLFFINPTNPVWQILLGFLGHPVEFFFLLFKKNLTTPVFY